MITVSWSHLFTVLSSIVVSLSLVSYYTYSYLNISPDLYDDILTKCFLAYIVSCWISIPYELHTAYLVYRYWGGTMHMDMWTSLKLANKHPFTLIKLKFWLDIGLGIYFLTIFTPVTSDNCDIYWDSSDACRSMQIITVLTYIYLACAGICIVGCLCCLPCICINIYEQNRRNNSINHAFASLSLSNYLPISSRSDDICPICYEAELADGASNAWTKLECSHGFHVECLSVWLRQHNTCPMCRSVVIPGAAVV